MGKMARGRLALILIVLGMLAPASSGAVAMGCGAGVEVSPGYVAYSESSGETTDLREFLVDLRARFRIRIAQERLHLDLRTRITVLPKVFSPSGAAPARFWGASGGLTYWPIFSQVVRGGFSLGAQAGGMLVSNKSYGLQYSGGPYLALQFRRDSGKGPRPAVEAGFSPLGELPTDLASRYRAWVRAEYGLNKRVLGAGLVIALEMARLVFTASTTSDEAKYWEGGLGLGLQW